MGPGGMEWGGVGHAGLEWGGSWWDGVGWDVQGWDGVCHAGWGGVHHTGVEWAVKIRCSVFYSEKLLSTAFWIMWEKAFYFW